MSTNLTPEFAVPQAVNNGEELDALGVFVAGGFIAAAMALGSSWIMPLFDTESPEQM